MVEAKLPKLLKITVEYHKTKSAINEKIITTLYRTIKTNLHCEMEKVSCSCLNENDKKTNNMSESDYA